MKPFSKIIAAICSLGVLSALSTGCAETEKPAELPKVSLSVWCASDEVPLTEQLVNSFKTKYENEATFNITISEEEELSCKETVLANPSAAADIFAFAADQFKELHDAGALLEVTLNAEKIIADNGGADNGAIRSASTDGKLFAYPKTASNGYFLYYNSKYLTENDVKSFDRILEVAQNAGKKVTMDYTSGWYLYSFFKGAGLNVELSGDGVTNACDFNSADGKYKGTDVAEAMFRIAQHPAFVSGGADDFKKFIKSGDFIAGINGAWNSGLVSEAFGDGYAAAKLPEYTIAGDSVQMCSFAGYKHVGVNSATEFPEWSMRLAEFLTNEESQTERFKARGEGPSNINAANSPEVKASPAIRALGEQAAFGYLQNVGGAYWQPMYVFGTTLASGNKDGTGFQKLLDILVSGIVSVPEET